MLVVLDSNAFHGDVHANRGLVRSILEAAGAEEGFELFIPEVAMQELDKHYAAETKKVVRDVNQAIGEHRDELRRLGIGAPPRIERDEKEVAGYRAALEERLESVGAQILPVPADLAPALPWAVHRRKPFKESGKGFPDAVIWLAILELAVDRKPEQVVFVCKDSDFAVSGNKAAELAPELANDLVGRGCAADQVRLVAGIGSFANEIGVNFEPALIRAKELATACAFDTSLIDRLAFSRIGQEDLGLDFTLDEDPWVESVDVRSVEIEAAAELPGKRLRIDGTAELTLLLNLDIYKADFYLAEDDVPLSATEIDPENPYVEAELEVSVNVGLDILTDMDASNVELGLTGVVLTPGEQVRRALHGRRLERLYHEVGPKIDGAGIDAFVPEEAIESDIDETTLDYVVDEEGARLVELTEAEGTSFVCQIEVDVGAHVSWSSNSPTTFDAEHFASLAVDEGTGAPVLRGYDKCLLTVDLTATWNVETQTWIELDVNSIDLNTTELQIRGSRRTAADDLEQERWVDAAEEQLVEQEKKEEKDGRK